MIFFLNFDEKRSMFLELIFPNRCLHCTRIIERRDWVCEACWHQISWSHYDFNTENDFAKRCRIHFPVENAYALFEYVKKSPVQKAIHQLKYKHREVMGEILSEEFIIKNKTLPLGIDCIVYIPIHERKKRDRGYNQLTGFCNTLAKHFDIDIVHDALIRNIHSKAQAHKSKQERSRTDGIFSCKKQYDNTHFLLVDDVFTTGNTLSAAAWELLKSGKNNKVSVLVIAEDR